MYHTGMKNKYHFTISFADLSDSKKLQIIESIVNTLDLNILPVEEQIDDPDYTQDRIEQLVLESCQRAWNELEVIIDG